MPDANQQQQTNAVATANPHAGLVEMARNASPEAQLAIINAISQAPNRSDPVIAALAAQATAATIGTEQLKALGITVEQQQEPAVKQVVQAQIGTQQLKALGATVEQQQESAVTKVAEAQRVAVDGAAKGQNAGQIAQQIGTEVGGQAFAQNTAQTAVQQQKHLENTERLATDRVNNEEHLVKIGQAEPAKEPHPLAHLVSADLKADLKIAMGNYESEGAARKPAQAPQRQV